MTNRFGTNDDMIIQDVVENGTIYALAIDSRGLYLTTRDKLNTRMADVNRFACDRSAVAARLSALGLNPAQLASDNQHKIKTTEVSEKKVNPLKASKRAMKKNS